MNNLCSVIRFNVKEGFQDKFVDAWKEPPLSNATLYKLISLEGNEFVSVAEIPDISDAIQDEEEVILWLNTVEHILIKYGGVRTDASSGLVAIGWENGKHNNH